MSRRRATPGRAPATELRPTIHDGCSRRFLARVAFGVEDGCFVAVDVAGRRHEWPSDVPRTVVLQTDLSAGVRQLHGSSSSLLVLDGDGRTLVHAPKAPFLRADVAAFCAANGLELQETEIDHSQPARPRRGPGYVALTAPRRIVVLQVVAVAAGVAFGLFGPLPFWGPALAGVVAALVLLLSLS